MATETVTQPRRAAIAERTLRTDRWWILPAITVAALVAFAVYATLRAFQNKYYVAEPLVSPAYALRGSPTAQPIGSRKNER